ncbi:MAG: ribosome biogenesis GTPase Der [Candidatus Doudnabacteria bacterium CG10_big_fil_rev_8_21_14_0_10_42_18]|uniref:GTPase Der n=1 Tax=Candidatus Doudnabacteria bacterium CG10_big_fil_rev_8_21_14_0_10_42_18 TaxID=1974552 RepID=A0A2H0VA60_9BACT|nr:MAG: ribosome biogenesis GTPase Der [Candidatus Doudnabacteria bacterium CG10_big_fil_rev_8_21_14_0_10_42_18]
MNKNLPIVAIVGAPNAGKSTLLNKIAGTRLAITSDMPGTTRDRQYLKTSWGGTDFMLVDTAGLALNKTDELESNIQKQLDIAIKEAEVIIFVVDGKEPVAAVPKAVIDRFRKTAPRGGAPKSGTAAGIKTPVVLAINKVDSSRQREIKLREFARLGIKPSYALSALTGSGIGDLLDELIKQLKPPKKEPKEEDPKNSIAVAIVGKPNVGKSSIFNAILKEERAVVSSVPGTTRTAIDDEISINGIDYTFIDTAGLKKKIHRQHEADIFSGYMTFKSIRRSDVCLFVVDASEPPTKQDQAIAREIMDQAKGVILIANKADLLEHNPFNKKKRSGNKGKNDNSYHSLQLQLSHHFPFFWMSPVFFVSAINGNGISEAIAAIKPIFEARHKTMEDEDLREFLKQKLKQAPPKPLRDQKLPKVFSLTQLDVNPPMFQLMVNHPGAISKQFKDFLKNSITKDLGYWGTPIVLKLKGKK